MSNYALLFRGPEDRSPSPAEEAAWGDWFQQIGQSIADTGHRVGIGRALGTASGRSDVPTGYTVIKAASLDEAERLAAGCPGLAQGGGVEVAPLVEM